MALGLNEFARASSPADCDTDFHATSGFPMQITIMGDGSVPLAL